MDIKKEFDRFKDQGSFLKVTSSTPIESAQKAVLNRKGNQMYNDGNVEGAKKVFLTTKYSDGLSRIGDYYKSQNKPLEALQMYLVAPDRTKSQPLIEQLAAVLQGLILEDENLGVAGGDLGGELSGAFSGDFSGALNDTFSGDFLEGQEQHD